MAEVVAVDRGDALDEVVVDERDTVGIWSDAGNVDDLARCLVVHRSQLKQMKWPSSFSTYWLLEEERLRVCTCTER